MKKVTLYVTIVVIGCLALITNTQASSGSLPRILTMGTMPAGTLVNIQGAGMADLISKFTPMNTKVQSVTSEEVWVPMMQSDEIDVGVAVSLTMRNSFTGRAIYKDIAGRMGVKSFPVSLITVGSPIRISLLVAGDSGINTLSDLKGKRVAMFAEKTAFDLYTRAVLANGGVDLADIKKYPVANPVEAVRSVMDRNVDACMVAVDAPIISEAVAKVKAHWLPVESSPDAIERMKAIIETSYVDTCPGGAHVGVPQPQAFMYLDVYLVARNNLSEAAVYELTKVLWEKNSELTTKPMLKEWQADRFVSKNASVAYHPGAIKWYQKNGVWADDMDTIQKHLLSEKP